MPKLRLALTALLVASLAHANAQDGKLYDWNDVEQYMTTHAQASTCSGINKQLKTDAWIDCRIDHPSFDAYFQKSYAQPNVRDREQNTPQNMCGEQAWYVLSGQEAMGGFPWGNCDDCVAEFKKLVKVVECRLDVPPPPPPSPRRGHGNPSSAAKITLVGGVLSFHVVPGIRDGWQRAELRKVLPTLDKFLGTRQ